MRPPMSMREREPNAKRIFRKAQARGLALAVLILLLACGSHPGNGPITTRGGGPTDIVLGPDGNLWFTEGTGTSARAKVFLGRITIRGTITEFPLPSGVVLNTIAAAADGTLWFTEFAAGKIGRIRPDGTIVEFTLPANPDDPSFVDMPMDGCCGRAGRHTLGLSIDSAGRKDRASDPRWRGAIGISLAHLRNGASRGGSRRQPLVHQP